MEATWQLVVGCLEGLSVGDCAMVAQLVMRGVARELVSRKLEKEFALDIDRCMWLMDGVHEEVNLLYILCRLCCVYVCFLCRTLGCVGGSDYGCMVEIIMYVLVVITCKFVGWCDVDGSPLSCRLF